MPDDNFKLIKLLVPITVEAHPMTDGRTYLCRKGLNFRYSSISEGAHDLEKIGHVSGGFFDLALGEMIPAQGIEAANAAETATEIAGSVHESPVRKDAPKRSHP